MSKDTQQQKHYKILLIGESCQDVYIYGNCSRLSQEAPVPIFDRNRSEIRAGMSANVHDNLVGLGCEICHITNESSIIKTRIIDQKFNRQILRIDDSDPCDVLEHDIFTKDQQLTSMSFDAVIFSDYNKGFLNYEYIPKILKNIRKNWPDIPIFVDTKKINADCFKDVILKVNHDEIKKMKSQPKDSEIIVTLGKNGAKWKGEIFSSQSIDVYDACGAGDTFISGLAYMYLSSRGNIRESIYFANSCAAYSVSKFGTYSLNKEDVKIIMENYAKK